VWVEGGDIHDELLDQLGGVLAPPDDLALTPSAAELEALAAAVAARWPGGAAVPAGLGPAEGAPAAEPSGADTGGEVRRLRWAGPRTRRIGSSAWRAGSVAAGLVLFSASAAAANGGVPLPRPVRVVAYTVGLPVDSPALDDTHQHIKELKEAVKAKDTPKAEATVRRLQTDLKKVPADEKDEAIPKVEAAITEAANNGVIQPPAPTTTTTAPPPSTTTTTAPASSTTATTAEDKEKEKEKAKETDRPAVTTTTAPTTTTTEPEPTTTTTAPETDGTGPGSTPGDPGTGGGHTGAGGDTEPGTTPTTVPPEPTTTTTTTAPPPEPTTTTTTAQPAEPTTTTTTTPPVAP
jgi:hypothetical protein